MNMALILLGAAIGGPLRFAVSYTLLTLPPYGRGNVSVVPEYLKKKKMKTH